MVAMAMHPWIPDLVTSSQQIKMADNVRLSFSSFNHNSCCNMMDLCLQNSFKMNIVNIYTLYWGNKAGGKQVFQLLASKVGDSQQWRISPNSFLTRCRRFDFKVTYYCSNHLKCYIYIYPKWLYCEVMLVFITEFLVVGSSKAAKSGKITARSAIFH